MQPSQLDITLHALSLQIAAVYRMAKGNPDNMPLFDLEDRLDDIILAYRSIRRHISKMDNGKRYGSNDAHRMMQGGI